ncbi:MAG: hypothetical protein F4168_04720, partial [Gemmatimonadetes bacterium]|nr:hypothetical protein [Gemmatimonadota bacterium]
DGVVGVPDFLLFIATFGSRQGDEKYEARYDLDGNGEIGVPDFLIFLDFFGQKVPPSSQLAVCDRTGAVRDSIVALAPVSTCGDVTAAHLAAIDSLSVNSASLTALKAGDFSGLTGLTKLNLFNNMLSSLPDGLFDDLQALTWLHLGRNQLTSIPSEVVKQTNLTSLWLWGNQLSGPVPVSELVKLSNLDTLSLSSNQFSGEIPVELTNLTNLTYLSLGGNQFSGSIPASELFKLSNLT